MKYKSLLIILILLPFFSFSQLSVELKSSFALPVQNRIIGSKTIDNLTVSNYKNSFGYGFDNTLNIYKHFGDKFKAGIGFSYHNGSKFKSSELINHDANGDLKTTVYTESYSKYISIEPKFQFVLSEKIDIDFGLLSLVNSSVYHENLKDSDIENNNTVYSIQEIKGRVSLGFIAGVDYKLYSSERFLFAINMNYRNVDFVTKNAEMILYEVNGVDRLSSLIEQKSKTEYVKEISSDDNQDNTKPLKELEYKLPFNSVSIGLNLSFKF